MNELFLYFVKIKISAAVEALQLLSQPRDSTTVSGAMPSLEVKNSFFSLDKLNHKKDIRPRAFFLLMSDNLFKVKDFDFEKLDMNQLVDNEHLFLVPFNSNKQSISIGSSVKMDMVLDESLFNSSRSKSTSECVCISKKHACVYYDKCSNTYELLNYSEYGTVVDNFCYGLDVGGIFFRCTNKSRF